jgi:hypothetical protein
MVSEVNQNWIMFFDRGFCFRQKPYTRSKLDEHIYVQLASSYQYKN